MNAVVADFVTDFEFSRAAQKESIHMLIVNSILTVLSPVLGTACRPFTADTTLISFGAKARLARSNLGGVGGRCDADGSECTQGLRTASTPPDVYIENVAPNVDLQLTNESEYRTWNANANGLRPDSLLGVINLMAPRQQYQASHWQPTITFTQIRFSFRAHTPALIGAPVTLSRVYFSFLDFDTKTNGAARECLALLNGQSSDANGAADVHTTVHTSNATELARLVPPANESLWPSDALWARALLYCASERGDNSDNPTDPSALSALSASRAILVELTNTSSLVVRLLPPLPTNTT